MNDEILLGIIENKGPNKQKLSLLWRKEAYKKNVRISKRITPT